MELEPNDNTNGVLFMSKLKNDYNYRSYRQGLKCVTCGVKINRKQYEEQSHRSYCHIHFHEMLIDFGIGSGGMSDGGFSI